jgi:hypothetical protein
MVSKKKKKKDVKERDPEEVGVREIDGEVEKNFVHVLRSFAP